MIPNNCTKIESEPLLQAILHHELRTLLPWNWRPASNIELSEVA
jgi:hypothetical protein